MYETSPACSAQAQSAETIQRHIDSRTWRRVRQLRVDCSGARVAVRGVASSYYVKQLAISALREVLPSAPVDLDIQVK